MLSCCGHSVFIHKARYACGDQDLAAGKPRQRPGRRRNAAKRSPEAVRTALDAAMSMYSLSEFKLFWDLALDTKALLAWTQDTAVLAFRGTSSLTNAWSDLQVPILLSVVHSCSRAWWACTAGHAELQHGLGGRAWSVHPEPVAGVVCAWP